MHNKKIYLILDFDDCIFEHPAGLDASMNDGYLNGAIDFGMKIPDPVKAKADIDEEYFNGTGFAHLGLKDYEGFDSVALFKHIHQYLLHHESHVPAYSDKIKDNRARVEHTFTNLPDNVEMVILTHGHRDWVRAHLETLGISDLFPDERIVDAVDANFQAKGSSPHSLELALERLGFERNATFKDQAIFMFDDNDKYLEYAHERGIHTVHVGKRGIVPSNIDKPGHVSEIAESLFHYLPKLKWINFLIPQGLQLKM